MDWKEIVGQAFSIAATLITFLSYQMNRKQTVLITQTLATVCMCLGYFFLGATAGFALNVLGIARNITYYFIKGPRRVTLTVAAIFALGMAGVGALAWQGWYSILIITALAANTVFLSLGEPQLLRKSILFTSSAIFIYNVFVFSIGGMTNELVAICSSVIGILRFRNRQKG